MLGLAPFVSASRNDPLLASRLLCDNHPVLLEGLHCCYLLKDKRLQDKKMVVRLHNIEHSYYYNLFLSEKNLWKRLFFLVESARLLRFQGVLGRANHLLALSRSDQSYFSSRFQSVSLVPVFHPNTAVSSETGFGEYVLFHGNLSVAENEYALRFLIRKVFYDLPVPIKVAGRNPSARLCRMIRKYPHIDLIANPSDENLFSMIKQAHVNVCVSFQGTGFKLKLLNALYNGRFCMANQYMLQESSLHSLCYVANDPEAMRTGIRDLMQTPFTGADIDSRAIALKQSYDNQANATQLKQILF